MSLITLIGIEQLVDAQVDLIYAEQDSGISSGSSGWDPNWANPSGLTGDWTPEITTEINAAVELTFEALLSSPQDFIKEVSEVYTNAGKFFTGAPGSFFDTGVDPETGLRPDGRLVGSGCGGEKTDAFVPDFFGKVDLRPSCTNHDTRWGTLGYSKELADAQLGQEVTAALIAGGYSTSIANAVGKIYEAGVTVFGTEAYAQKQAGAAAAAGRK
ncbi:hypothetical protein ACLB1G_19725 [Oxalobacteraceae bacterium A2-2]